MKMSTKGRYGLRAMVDLAAHGEHGHVPLKIIAQRQALSENYLEQVFSILRKAGMVRSIKGAQGGYVLADMPKSIGVGTILKALEGDIRIVDPASSPEPGSVGHCIDAHVWQRINKKVNSLLEGITLEDLLEEYNSISQAGTYHI
ncbi:MAG: Rrf2 family transcriptional regulator [Clostridia bacterium]